MHRNPDKPITQEMFARHWAKAQPMVHAVVRSSIRHPQDVEDVVQNVAAASVRDRAKYDPRQPFLPWVLTITRHAVTDYYRMQKRDRVHFDSDVVQHISNAAQHLAPHVSDRQIALEKCLERVEPRGRKMLEMRYYLDMTADAIAQKFGLSQAGVFSALHRLRLALGRCIEKEIESDSHK